MFVCMFMLKSTWQHIVNKMMGYNTLQPFYNKPLITQLKIQLRAKLLEKITKMLLTVQR